MDHSVALPLDLSVRNRRRLAVVFAAVALIGTIALLAVAVIHFVPSAKAHGDKTASAAATIPPGAIGPHTPAGRATLSPAQTPVMVLNGNGRSGAAAATAHTVRQLGYRLGLVGNAPRMDYPVSLVMYRPGLRADALKFAKAVHVQVVGPMNGIRPGKLGRAKLVYIVGAS